MNDKEPIELQVNNLQDISKHLTLDFIEEEGYNEIEGKVFVKCTFNGVIFNNILFKNCTFFNCDFSRADLSGLEFNNCNFEFSSIHYSRLEQVSFIKCKGDIVTTHSDFIMVTFNKCDLSDFHFRQVTFYYCNIFNPVSINWNCKELIAEILTERLALIPSNQQLKDLIAIIKGSGRCHKDLRNYQHFARKEAIQLLADYIKNENDLSVPEYLKEELVFIEKENQNG